jgi:GWxTD domain-containing protein
LNKRTWLAPILTFFFVGNVLAAVEKPTPELMRWLEDVSPIITKAERAVYARLQTNADRTKFVRFFWRSRDPLPDTSENEFQKEYEERIRYADENFGRTSPKRGSQTDRGFFYVLLGKPRERTSYVTQSQVWPLELWFYEGDTQYGLPPYFYLIFYQPEGNGDFRLYSPGVEGPEKLAVPTMGNGAVLTRSNAIGAIKAVSAELARASLSYLPSDSPRGAASFSSDSIIASVRNLPEKKFSDSYARSYMAFKDYVETEYSDRYIASAFAVRVFHEGGQPFIHWSIEPEKMDFSDDAGTIYASFELVLRLEDGRGSTIFERTEEIPLKVSPDQYRAHERQRFAFQDLLAVAPGEYRALFLLKNKTARDFSSFETRVAVPAPEPPEKPGLSGPLLYYGRSAVPEAQKKNLKAFVFGGQQYVTAARYEFPTAATLGVFVQAVHTAGLVPGAAPSFVADLISLDTNQSAGSFPLTETAPDPDDAATLLVSGTVPLKDVKPGYYRADVSLLGPPGQRLLTTSENFVVLGQPFPVIPWVYARLHGPYPGPEHLKILGSEYFLKGEYARAREIFERTLQIRDDLDVRLLLAKSLYALGLLRESLDEASAVHARNGDREAAKVIALDQAGLKDWTAALATLEKLMAEATEIPVLNLASECHMALGHPEKALPLLQKSLSLSPDQPAVRALEEEAKKRVARR